MASKGRDEQASPGSGHDAALGLGNADWIALLSLSLSLSLSLLTRAELGLLSLDSGPSKVPSKNGDWAFLPAGSAWVLFPHKHFLG